MPKAKQPSSFTSQPNRDSAQRSAQGSMSSGYGLTKCNDSSNRIDAKAEAFIQSKRPASILKWNGGKESKTALRPKRVRFRKRSKTSHGHMLMKTGVTMNKCGDVTHIGNHVKSMFKVDGLNLKSEELKKVRHFLGRASGQSRNGARRWGKVAISSKWLVVDSGATKTLIKGNNFMKKILNKYSANSSRIGWGNN